MVDSFRPVPTKAPTYCARILAVCPDGKIFLIKKSDDRRELPGGGDEPVDEGNPARTALREFAEETGVYLDGESKITRLKQIARIQKKDNHIWICYLLFITEDELRWYTPETQEGKAIRVHPRDIASRDCTWTGLHIDQYRLIKNYLNGDYK